MTRLVQLIAILLLVGCQTAPTKPAEAPRDPVITAVVAEVGVRETCRVEMPAEPTWRVDTVAKDADIFTRSQAILVELEQHRMYLTLVKAAVQKCN